MVSDIVDFLLLILCLKVLFILELGIELRLAD